MGDDYEGTGWAKYVRQVSKRPGWSVARLSRETRFSKSTFFDWMSPDSRKAVTIPYIVAVAKAVGDDPVNAFKAAAGLTTDEPQDEEISMVLSAEIPDKAKDEIIAGILEQREIDRRRRLEDTQRIIRIYEGAA